MKRNNMVLFGVCECSFGVFCVFGVFFSFFGVFSVFYSYSNLMFTPSLLHVLGYPCSAHENVYCCVFICKILVALIFQNFKKTENNSLCVCVRVIFRLFLCQAFIPTREGLPSLLPSISYFHSNARARSVSIFVRFLS